MSEYDNSEPHAQYDWYCDLIVPDDLDCFVEKNIGILAKPPDPYERQDYVNNIPVFDTIHTYHMQMIPVDVSDFDGVQTVMGMFPHLKSYLHFTWSFE